MMYVASSPHHHNKRSTPSLMLWVMLACIPGILAQLYWFGPGILIQISLALITAFICELLTFEMRGRHNDPAITDNSGLLCGLLLAVSIPSLAPWWVIVSGTAFSVIIAKQLYGGLGHNMFNPAMVGYIFLLISFPIPMTSWPAPTDFAVESMSLMDSFYMVFTGYTSAGFDLQQLRYLIDGTTMATPLDANRTGIQYGKTVSEVADSLPWGNGHPWLWISGGYLVGGLYLLRAGLIRWHIPVGTLVGTVVTSSVLFFIDASIFASPWFHLVNGSVVICAFFISTDPVSAATTNKGRLIYGLGIGFFIVIIRSFGAYPDAVAFAVVLLNVTVPLIDYYTKPRAYGHKQAAEHDPNIES